ncbi:hypothetical protein CsatB_016484 [Cannabis sativa]
MVLFDFIYFDWVKIMMFCFNILVLVHLLFFMILKEGKFLYLCIFLLRIIYHISSVYIYNDFVSRRYVNFIK